MKKFILTFDDSDGNPAAEVNFELADTELASAWLAHAQTQLVHIATSGEPTSERKRRQWQIIKHFITQANQDHLLDEWIHLPSEMPSDYQPLLNKIRLRAVAYENYASANNQQSITRESLLRTIQAIDALESTNDPLGYAAYVKFKIPQSLAVSTKYSTAQPGSIVLTHPNPTRTLYQAQRAVDDSLMAKKLISNWTTQPTAFSLFVLNDFTARHQPVQTEAAATANYVKLYSESIAHAIDYTESLSRYKVSGLRL